MYKMYGNFLPVHRVCLSKIIRLAFNWIIYLLPNYTHKHTYTVCVLSTYLSTVKKMTRLGYFCFSKQIYCEQYETREKIGCF